MGTADIKVAITADTSSIVAGLKQAETAMEKVAESVAVVTDAEKALAAQIAASESAQTARAKALGLSVSQLAKLDRELAASVKAEADAAAATERAAQAQVQAAAAAGKATAAAQAEAAAVRAAKAAEAASWAKTVAETEHYAAGTLGATVAAERSAKMTGQQSASLKNLAAQLADVGKGLASGVSPFQIATQQGDQLLGALSGLGGMLPTLGLVAGGVAAVAAVLGTAYVVSAASAAESSADAAARLQTSADAAKNTKEEVEALTKAWDDFIGDTAAIQSRIDVINHTLTKNQAAARKEGAKLTEEANKSIKADADRYASLTVLAQGYERVTNDIHASVDEQVSANSAAKAARAEAAALKKRIDEHKASLAGSIDLLEQEAEYLDLSSDAKDRNSRSTKGAKDALDEWNAALKSENDIAEKNAKTYRDALDTIDGMSFGLKKSKSDVENLSDAYHANLEAIKASETEALAVVSGNADAEYTARHAALLKSTEAQAAYYRDVDALREASERAADDAAREAAKRAADLAKRQTAIFEDGEKDRKDIAVAYAAAGASIAGSVGDAFALVQSNMTGLSKKEAATLFRVTQAAQLAEALILAPAAILQGLAQAGPAGGVAAGIAAGVQVAAIAAAKPPSFRQGTSGYYGAPAGEKAITAHVGEGEGLAVVSRQGMAGARAEGVDARNAGLSGGTGGALNVSLNMSGRMVGRVMVGAMRGASGRQAVAAGAKTSFVNPYRKAA